MLNTNLKITLLIIENILDTNNFVIYKIISNLINIMINYFWSLNYYLIIYFSKYIQI